MAFLLSAPGPLSLSLWPSWAQATSVASSGATAQVVALSASACLCLVPLPPAGLNLVFSTVTLVVSSLLPPTATPSPPV